MASAIMVFMVPRKAKEKEITTTDKKPQGARTHKLFEIVEAFEDRADDERECDGGVF